jgi:hypothetical protein
VANTVHTDMMQPVSVRDVVSPYIPDGIEREIQESQLNPHSLGARRTSSISKVSNNVVPVTMAEGLSLTMPCGASPQGPLGDDISEVDYRYAGQSDAWYVVPGPFFDKYRTLRT